MAQEQTTNMQQQEAMQDMLAMAQRQQQGEAVSLDELQAFVTKNKDILPTELTSQMQQQIDAFKTIEQSQAIDNDRAQQNTVQENAAPASPPAPSADAAPMKNFDDSFAMERTALERGIAEKSAEREMKANQREAIKGTNTIQSAAIGGISAAATMKIAHGMYNDQNILTKMLKEAEKKGITEAGTIDGEKIAETVKNFGKALFVDDKKGKITLSSEQLASNAAFKESQDAAINAIKDSFEKGQAFTTEAMTNTIQSSVVKDNIDATVVEKVKDLTKGLVKEINKASGQSTEALRTDATKKITSSFEEKIKPLITEGKLSKEDGKALVEDIGNKAKNLVENKNNFDTKVKDETLEAAQTFSKDIATKGRKFGEFMQKPVEGFNNLNKDGNLTGRLAQFGVVAAVVVGTAAVVAGVDHLLKSGGDKKKQELTSDIRNFDKDIANDKVKLTSFVDKYAADAAKAEQQASFAQKVSRTEGENDTVKTNASFGDKVRIEQEQAKTAELSV